MSTPQPEALITAEDVYQILRKEIMTLRLAPGTMLSENTIVARFGLSRTPVRAVISRLAHKRTLILIQRLAFFLCPKSLALQGFFIRPGAWNELSPCAPGAMSTG